MKYTLTKCRGSKKRFQDLIKEIKHAFSLERSDGASLDDENDFLERFATGISRRKLAAPAMLFLETIRPLNYIGTQAMTFFRPFLSIVFPMGKYDKMSHILEKRDSINKLIKLLENNTWKRDGR